jgi:organic radical activating enzyme
MEEIERYGPYPTSTGNHDLTWLKQSGRFPYKQSDDNPYVDAFWKYLPEIYEKLRVLRVTGGEPLMSKDVWKLLEFIKLNPQPNLELAINTNLCVENKLIDKFINEVNELTGKVKRIDVYTSIESSGIRAEYARYGLNYAQWQKNVRKILSETESTVGIMTTVNALSLSTTVDFLESIMQLRKEFNTDFANNRIPVSINYLRWPNHLSVNVLPTELRSSYALDISTRAEKWLKYYNADGFARLYLEEWDQVKRLCDYLSTVEPADPTDFIKFVDELDRRRGTNFYMTFPEYREFIQCQRNQTNH